MTTDILVYKNLSIDQRKWYNKLWLSESLGYNCGPSGIAPQQSEWYIIRPMINLSGMGIGAKRIWIDAGDHTKVPPGYFWCEWFYGNQYSVTYEWQNFWKPVSCWQGIKEVSDLSKFTKWIRTDFYPELNEFYDELQFLEKINVEFIGKNTIEVHLRTSPDPDYDELIPIWEKEDYLIDIYKEKGYNYISSYDDGEGFLNRPRLGFMVKNFD